MLALLTNLIFLIIGAYILVRSATLLVHSISLISRFFKLSEFTTAFILMGFITSIPEIAVAISAAASHDSGLTLGAVFGSNLTDLTLIIAIPILVSGGFQVRSIIARKDSIYMALFAAIPIIMLLDGTLSRIDAVILIVFYGLYLFRLLSQRPFFVEQKNYVTKKVALKQGLVFILATTALFAASQLIVYASQAVAQSLSISTILVGLVLVSAGTSLPELAHGLKSISLHHDRQVIGDILGSVVANSTIVLALAALIHPIQIANLSEIMVSLLLFILVIFLFLHGVYNDKKLSVKEALILLSVYLIFLITEFGLEIAHHAAQ